MALITKQNVCPKCGSTDVGTSTAHKFKKGAAYVADFAVGAVAGYFLGAEGASNVLSETGAVSDNVHIEKEYECRSCGYIWKGEGTQMIPDYIIQEHKDKLEADMKSEAQKSGLWTIIYGIATIICGYYCIVNDFTSKAMEHNWLFGDMEVTNYNWLWLLLFIVGICTAFAAYGKFVDYSESSKTAREVSNMSVAEFRRSKYLRRIQC